MKHHTLAAALLLAACLPSSFAETLVFDAPETAALCGYRVLWDTPIATAPDGVRVVTDDKVKDRGGVAPFAQDLRDGGAKPAALAFDAIHRSLLVRFPGAAEAIAAKVNAGFAIEKAELVLPFADEELWPEGNPNGVPPGGGYVYRANWGTDSLYRAMRPTWHAVAWALRQPWKADAELGPTYNAFIRGAGYWTRFGAQDETTDRVPVQLGPTPVHYQHPEGRMDVTAALNDPAFGATPGARLRRLADCGFLLKKWETYDHRFFTGCYEWSTGTGPRAIVIRQPSLSITFAKGKAARVDLPPTADIAALAAELKRTGKGGKPTAVMPSSEELALLAERLRFKQRPGMPDWQWARIQELFAAAYGPGAKEVPFWHEFVPSHIQNRYRFGPDGKWAQNLPPVSDRVYEAFVDELLGKPFRGWYGFEAGPVLVTWFLYRDALPLPAQEAFHRYWTALLMPDRETCDTDKLVDPDSVDGRLVHPMSDQLANRKGTADSVSDTYYAKTGDWRGNKSFYRSGFNYTMSTVNFNNTASMGALLGGAVIGSDRAIADGRHGQANFALKLWTWFDGSSQEEGDDYYFGVTLRAQKMVAAFGPDAVDRLLGRSMLIKGMTMLVDTYHPGLRRYITGASRTSPYHRLVTQDGLYSILHTLSQRGALTDLGVPEAELPEGEKKFGHEFPPDQVARTAAVSSYAPAWYQQVVDEKPLPYEVSATFKRWGGHVVHPIQKKTFLGRNFGLYSMNAEEAFLPAIAQWRRQAKTVETSRELGTMLMRMGSNQTRFVNDAPGWILSYGNGAILQSGPKLIASYSPWGAGLDAKRAITSLQASLAFYNYELPAPTWELYVDGVRVQTLPHACKAGQKIAIKDGVTYIGITPLPGSNLGRDAEVVLRAGEPQEYLNSHHATAALVIDHYILKRAEPLAADADWAAVDKAATGFAVEYADAEDFAGFPAFLKHLAGVQVESVVDVEAGVHNVKVVSGKDTLEMGAVTVRPNQDLPLDQSFTYRRVNGVSPDLPAGVERLSPFSMHATTGSLERGGATLAVTPGQHAMLQREPRTGVVLGVHPLAELSDFALKTPEGVEVAADGKVGLAFVTVDPANKRIEIEHAFLPEQLADAAAAHSLHVFGAPAGAVVSLNGEGIEAPESVEVAGRKAWAVPLRPRD